MYLVVPDDTKGDGQPIVYLEIQVGYWENLVTRRVVQNTNRSSSGAGVCLLSFSGLIKAMLTQSALDSFLLRQKLD